MLVFTSQQLLSMIEIKPRVLIVKDPSVDIRINWPLASKMSEDIETSLGVEHVKTFPSIPLSSSSHLAFFVDTLS